MVFQSLAIGWRRFWSRKLIAKYYVKAQYFTVSFKIYQSEDGERTCRMSVKSGDSSNIYAIQRDDLDLLVEAAQEARAQLRTTPAVGEWLDSPRSGTSKRN